MAVQVFVFPDTNVFLHFQFFDEVDWAAQIGVSNLMLMLTPSVLSELDEHKWSGTRREKTRAQKVLKRLDALGLSVTPVTVRPGVSLMALDSEPADGLFDQHRLSRHIKDDRLLASALEFSETAQGARLVVLTDDTGLRIKGRSRRLEVAAPPGALRSEEEPDETERALEKATRELAEARSAAPDLRLAFEDGENHLHIEWRPVGAFDDSAVERLMAEWRERHPHVKASTRSVRMPDGSSFSMDGLADVLPGSYSKRGAAEANAEIDRIGYEYENYLRGWPEALNSFTRTIEFRLVLENTGTAPADDVHVRLTTDAPGRWIDEAPDVPRPPELPPPRDPFDLNIRPVLADYDLPLIRRYDEPIEGPNVSEDEEGPAEVHWTVKRAQHHVPVALPAVYFQFDSTRAVGSFRVDVRLAAANMRKPRTAALHVEIAVGDVREPPPPSALFVGPEDDENADG